MLLQFSAQNFLSFKDEATLSMVASKRRSKNKLLDLDAIQVLDDEVSVLKTALIYGPNNSGKSNLIKALRFFKGFVLDSSRESTAKDPIKVTPFLLHPETAKTASTFEIIFVRDNQIYQYEVSATAERVERERLSRRAIEKHAGSVELFSRIGDDFKLNRSFKEGKGLEGRTRPNALFLSVCANFDGPLSTAVLEWFSGLRIVSGLTDSVSLAWTANRLDDPEYGPPIQALLRSLDLGIDRFEQGESIPGFRIEGVDVTSDGSGTDSGVSPDTSAIVSLLGGIRRRPTRKVVTFHQMRTDDGEVVKEVAFDLLGNESDGTQKLVALAGPIVASLRSAYVLVIDEFESRLHTNLSKVIIGLFNSRQGNPNGAQLIAATHDTNLLSGDQLRRDQIWFTGRDGMGRSTLTSLIEFRVRNDASYEKRYLEGDYGSTPFVRPELAMSISTPMPTAGKTKAAKRRAS